MRKNIVPCGLRYKVQQSRKRSRGPRLHQGLQAANVPTQLSYGPKQFLVLRHVQVFPSKELPVGEDTLSDLLGQLQDIHDILNYRVGRAGNADHKGGKQEPAKSRHDLN